jgi:catechol 2,3-dioxygenase-like lactoylglutathione lyase family enzyme
VIDVSRRFVLDYRGLLLGMPADLTVTDVRPFLPAADFERSLAFYTALGWTTVWSDESLALLSLAGHQLMLQDYYVREWAENWMLVVEVADAAAWHDHVGSVLASGDFGDARVAAPEHQDYGATVTYVWDPCGVLLHFTEWDT